ncbi:MAG: YdeI/OmpD-associated family protein [Bacteroidetes bacterium]|nr:YdeI/OmpD-associated family protein [Bacteroidota bacterium]
MLENPVNVHNRHIKFTDVKQIDDKVILEYLFEAIDNNRKGLKIIETKDKTIITPDDVVKAFKKAKVLAYFDSLAFRTARNMFSGLSLLKEETRTKRIEQAIEKLLDKQMIHDKYKK